jgi:hypothetical protein
LQVEHQVEQRILIMKLVVVAVVVACYILQVNHC